MLPPAILKLALVLAQTLEEMQVICTYLQLYRKKKVWLPSLFYFMMLLTTVLSLDVRRLGKKIMFSFLAFLQIKINCYNKSKSTYACDIADIT